MDRLYLEDKFVLPQINLRVAIITQMIYPSNPEKQSYETTLFSMDDDRSIVRVKKDYKEEPEAQQGHKDIFKKLKIGNYKLTPVKWVIEIGE